MAKVLSLSSSGGSFTAGDSSGIRGGARSRGFGLPPVATQWFEGAGEGASYRGGRVLPRVMDLQFRIYRDDREGIADAMELIGSIFDPRATEARLSVALGGAQWYVGVRRTGGGDWEQVTDTDNETFLKTIVTVQAGRPFFERVDAESKQIVLGGLGRGLIKSTAGVDSLAFLRVSSDGAFGDVDFSNSGKLEAYPVWTVEGPFSGFTLTSQKGEVVDFQDAATAGQTRVVDMRLGTVKDGADPNSNLYDKLGPTPRFWTIPPGESTASVVLPGATSATKISVVWAPRRWVAF